MIEILNTTETTLTASQNIPLGAVSAKSNNNVSLLDNTLLINSIGYYDIKGQFVVTATSTGAITIQLLANGNEVKGAYATQTVTEGDTVSLGIGKVLKILPTSSNSKVNISFQTNSACTLINSRVEVNKIL